MCGADDQWVKAAMADDTVVVELLLRLHGAVPKPSSLPLKWSVRQRRSRPVASGNNRKKEAQRASPATPLSWSGGTSLSGGSGGSGGRGSGYDEESSRPTLRNVSAATRSKVNSDGERTASKRSRKKKTLAELRDEERSLLKERRELRRDIAAFRLNLEKERTTNESLKRMKIESQPLPDRVPSVDEESNANHLQQKTTTSACHHPILPTISSSGAMPVPQPSTSDTHPGPEADNTSNTKFMLPDLNLPFNESPCPCPGVLHVDSARSSNGYS